MASIRTFYSEVDPSNWLRTDISFNWQQYAKISQLKICEYQRVDLDTLQPIFTAYFVAANKPLSGEDSVHFFQALVKGEYYQGKKWWVNPKKLFMFIGYLSLDARLQYEMPSLSYKGSALDLLQHSHSWNKMIMKEISAYHIQAQKNNRFQLTLAPILEKPKSRSEITVYPKTFFIDNREKKDASAKHVPTLTRKTF